MMVFNGQVQEISFIYYIIDILIATMDGLEVILIGCLVLLLRTRKMCQKFGEETNDLKMFVN